MVTSSHPRPPQCWSLASNSSSVEMSSRQTADRELPGRASLVRLRRQGRHHIPHRVCHLTRAPVQRQCEPPICPCTRGNRGDSGVGGPVVRCFRSQTRWHAFAVVRTSEHETHLYAPSDWKPLRVCGRPASNTRDLDPLRAFVLRECVGPGD